MPTAGQPLPHRARASESRLSSLGTLLRQWRATRRMSQLDLALEAEISSRHLSYVESGKSQPTREMISRLADALDVPLRERNVLLIAAGYAPIYSEAGLNTTIMAQAKRAIEYILKQHEPFPVIVMNRNWDLLMANNGAASFLQFLLGKIPSEKNVVRKIFSADFLRPYISNWDEVAGDMIRRLHQEVAWMPTDKAKRQLLSEALASPGIPERWRVRDVHSPQSPVMPFEIKKGEVQLRFFSAWTTFGTPQDVTVEEMRIETSFPADEKTARLWPELVGKLQASNLG